MSYYCFNKPQLLQKAKDKYHNCRGKEKAAKYYIANKEAFFFLKKKKKANNKYRSLSKEEKEAKREYGRNMYKNMLKKKTKSVEELKYYFFCIVQK